MELVPMPVITPRSPSLLPIVAVRTSTVCCCTLAIPVRNLLLLIIIMTTSVITLSSSSSSFTTTTAFFHRAATTFVPLPTVRRRTFRTTTTWPRRSTRPRIPSVSPPLMSTVRRYSSSSSTTVKPLLLPHLKFVSSTTTTTATAQPHPHDPVVVIFLHGLLGNKRNFASMGRSLLASSSSRVIYSLDLRHHGDSYDYRHAPHQTSSSSSSLEEHTTTTTTITNADDMSYRTMAQDVIHFCNVHGIAQIDTLIGHSIGGKVAQ